MANIILLIVAILCAVSIPCVRNVFADASRSRRSPVRMSFVMMDSLMFHGYSYGHGNTIRDDDVRQDKFTERNCRLHMTIHVLI